MKYMIYYRVTTIHNRSTSGAVAVEAADPNSACSKVASMARAGKLNGLLPGTVEDVTVQCLGPA